MRSPLLLLSLALVGCNGLTADGSDPSAPRTDGRPTPAPEASVTSPCQPPCQGSEVCDPVKLACVPKSECGALSVNPVAPNLLIVLDRSCSMTALVGGKKKFEVAVAALKNLLSKEAGRFRFGLALFPDTDQDKCGQGSIPIPVAPDNEAKIKALLEAATNPLDPNYPDGPCVTPIDTALQRAAAEPALKDAGRASYVLLLTDGKQAGCSLAGGDSGSTQIITKLHQAGVPTFVVGFGGGVDPDQLNIFADAGGKPRPDPKTRFHKAEDQLGLEAALATISKESFGCVFRLQQPPPQLQKVYVFFDGAEVLQDKTHAGGWDLDTTATQLTFFGDACKSLEEHKVSALDVVYGCQAPVHPENNPYPGSCPSGVTACQTNSECGVGTACVSRCCTKVLQ
jgi:hypothetical protein